MKHLTAEQWAFIDAVGKSLGATDAARQKWRERGAVPWKFRPAIAARAKESGFRLPAEFLHSEAA